MTTMTTEATATLPLARLRRRLATGLEEGETHPYFAVPDGAPLGYSGALIMPAGTTAGWAIAPSHPRALHPYVGMQGWWVRDTEVAVTGEMSEITMSVAATGGVIDEGIPEVHRPLVPEGAYWVRMTRNVDGVPRDAEVLAMDDPANGASPRGPLLLFWPGHDYYRFTSTNRPGLPTEWHGWWAHGGAERIREVTRSTSVEVDRPDLPVVVGTRVRVIDDVDRPVNNGRIATVVEVRRGGGYPYCVDYDSTDGSGGAEQYGYNYRWWVREVVAVGPPLAPAFPHSDRFPVGHWYSWAGKSDWFRVGEVTEDGVNFDQYSYYTSGTVEDRARTYTIAELDRHRDPVCLAPGHAEMPDDLRRATMPFVVDQTMEIDTMRATRGIVVRRDGLARDREWVTHGDGTMTQVSGAVGTDRRMGIGQRDETHTPHDHWTRDGRWLFVALDESRVPAETPEDTPEPEFREGRRVLLTSRHVMVEGEEYTYRESRRPVGFATGVLQRRASGERQWHIRWDHGGNQSVLHESCITPMVEPGVGLEVGTKVILVTPHTTGSPYRDGGHQFTESPNGIGSIGVLDRRPAGSDWGVQWLNDDGSEARHSRVHSSCIAVYPNVEVEVAQEGPPFVPEGARRVRYTGSSERVGRQTEQMAIPRPSDGRMMHILFWPGHPTFAQIYPRPGRASEGVPQGWRSYRTDFIMDLGPWEATPEPTPEPTVRIEGVPDEHAAAVPEGATWVEHTGLTLRRGRYLSIETPDQEPGRRTALLWPGHPEWETGIVNRAGVPEGWRGFRMSSMWRDAQPIVRTGAPTPVGYEGVPEEHWASTPEGALRVIHRTQGGREWMAIPHPGNPRHLLLIAWPGHPTPLAVGADVQERLDLGVPAGWTSWAITRPTEQHIAPWPRIAASVPEEGDEVARLRAELAAVQERYDSDLRTIAEEMKREADERDWCEEYEEVMRRINGRINGSLNAERPTMYEVKFRGMVRIDGTIRLELPTEPTQEQVDTAIRSHFAEAGLGDVADRARPDWGSVDVDDLHAEEWDED